MKIKTSGATPVVAATLETLPNTAYAIRVRAVASNNDFYPATFQTEKVFWSDSDRIANPIRGRAESLQAEERMDAWALNILTRDGGFIDVVVTGEAGYEIEWNLQIEVQ